MARPLTEEKDALLRKLIRGGLTAREIARQVGCGLGTVTRRKGEMGLEVRSQVSTRVTKLLAPQPMPPEDDRPPPSAAALRLAAFDPIIRRAISNAPQEPEDE